MRRLLGVVAVVLLLAACAPGAVAPAASASTVRVGILHSLTGTLAISESRLVDAEKLAIDEINTAGGVTVDGSQRKIEPIVDDGESAPDRIAEKATKMATTYNLPVVFGCWPSASTLFKENHAVQICPVRSESGASAPNVYSTAGTFDRQLLPALAHLKSQGHRRLALVGTDDVFSRAANKRIKAYAAANGMTVTGEQYRPPGSADFAATVARLRNGAPDAVVSTITGDSNGAFFPALKKAGITAAKLPVLSLAVTEEEVRVIGPEYFAGHLVAANYFQTTKSAANERFVSAYKARYGEDAVTSDAMEAAYTAVHLWAKAVTKAGSVDSEDVVPALAGLTFDAPEGRVTMDGNTHQVERTPRIGVIARDGRINQV